MPIQFDCTGCSKKVQVPDSAAGRKVRCPSCQGILQVPDLIVEAEEVVSATPGQPSVIQPGVGDDEAHRVTCPLCGEMIVGEALQCRYCGEIFDETLKLQAKAPSYRRRLEDNELNVGAIVVALLPVLSWLTCIMGLVWLCQGKPKGGKLIGLSFIAVVFWQFVFRLIEHLKES